MSSQELINQVLLLHECNRSLEKQLESSIKQLAAYQKHSHGVITYDEVRRHLDKRKKLSDLGTGAILIMPQQLKKLLQMQQQVTTLEELFQEEKQQRQALSKEREIIIRDLEGRTHRHQQEKIQLERDIVSHFERITGQMKKQIEQKDNDIKELKAQTAEQRRLMHRIDVDLRDRIDLLQSEKEKLQVAVAESQSTINSLEKMNQSLKQKNDHQTQKIEQLNQQLTKMTLSLSSEKEISENCSKQIKHLENQNRELSNHLEAQKIKIIHLEDANKILMDNLQASKSNLSSKEKENLSSKQSFDELTKRNQRANEEINDKKRALEKEKKINVEKQLSLQSKDQQILLKTNEINTLAKMLSQQRERHDEEITSSKGLQEKIASSSTRLQRKLQQKEKKIKQLETKMEQTQDDHQRLIQKFASETKKIKTELAGKLASLNKLQKQKEQVEEIFHDKQEQLINKIKTLEEKRQNLETRLSSETVSKQKQKHVLSGKEIQLKDLKMTVTALEKELKQTKRSIEDLQHLLADKDREAEILQSSNATLKKQLIVAFANQEATRKQIVSKKAEQLKRLKTKKTIMTRDSEGRHVRTSTCFNDSPASFMKKRRQTINMAFQAHEHSNFSQESPIASKEEITEQTMIQI